MTVKSPEFDQARPQGCTSYRIRQLMQQVSQFFDAGLGQAGLKGTQYALMTQLVQLGPMRPGDLAKAMKMDASTLTRNTKPLLDAGWLCRSPGTDRRSRTISITDSGRQKWQQAQQLTFGHHHQRAHREMGEPISSRRLLPRVDQHDNLAHSPPLCEIH